PQGLGHLYLRRRGARPRRLDRHLQGRRAVLAAGRSVGALPHRPAWVVERRQGPTQDLFRRPIPDRGLRAVHEAGYETPVTLHLCSVFRGNPLLIFPENTLGRPWEDRGRQARRRPYVR